MPPKPPKGFFWGIGSEWIRVSLLPVLNALAQNRTKYFEGPDETSGSQFLCVLLGLNAQRVPGLVEPTARDKVQ